MFALFNEFLKHKWTVILCVIADVFWVTKYRCTVLEGYLKIRCGTLLMQICEAKHINNLEASGFKRPHLYRASSILIYLVQ
jgi:hypothetical protein